MDTYTMENFSGYKNKGKTMKTASYATGALSLIAAYDAMADLARGDAEGFKTKVTGAAAIFTASLITNRIGSQYLTIHELSQRQRHISDW